MAESSYRATIITAVIGLIGSVVVAVITNWDKFTGVSGHGEKASVQTPAPVRPANPADTPGESSASVVDISGNWRDPNNPGNGSQISQAGGSFQFNGWGVLPNGVPYESVGSGTITGRAVASTYRARYQNGWVSQGNCTGNLSGDGSRLTSTCTDSVLGTFVTAGVRN